MWQASLLVADRKIFQTGRSLDERDDRILVDLTDEQYAEIKAALAEPNGGVLLAKDGTLKVLEPEPEPEPTSSRDDRIRAVLVEKQAAVDASTLPDETKAVLSDILHSLGEALG